MRLDHVPVSLQFFNRGAGSSTNGSSTQTENYIIAASASNTVFLYDPRGLNKPLMSYKSDVRLNTTLADASSSKNQLFLGLENGMVLVRNPLDLNESLGEFKAHFGPCSTIAMDPMKRLKKIPFFLIFFEENLDLY